jgi:hypothetical protein
MPAIFSDLYRLPPNANAGARPIYQGPSALRRGQTVIRFSTYTGAITFNASPTVNDVLHIAGAFQRGERLIRLANTRSADPDAANDFTFSLGWRIGTAANPGTAFASASNAMQAAVAYNLSASDTAAAQAAAEGDDLILTAAAGAAEVTTVVHTFIVESFIP